MNAPVEGLRNRLWEDLKVGDEAAIEKTVTPRDLYLFAHASGNLNPMHMPQLDIDHDGISDAVAPSMWIGSLISCVLGNVLPGPGTLYRKQSFDFVDRAHIGDVISISVRLIEKLNAPDVIFETIVTKVGGPVIASGHATVSAPSVHVSLAAHELPALLLEEHDHFSKLIMAAKNLEPMPTAVVCPDDSNSLKGTLLAMREGLIIPILIGSKAKIEEAAKEAHEDLSLIQIIDLPDHIAAAAKAVELVHSNQVRAIMKGNLHSDELLAQVVKREGGLRTSRRISHVFAMNVPTLDHP
jgi:phosphate butyryltransferase